MSSDVVGRPIVAGVDGSDSARHAALWAADEAVRRRVPLRLVFVAHMPMPGYPGGVGLSMDFVAGLRDEGRRLLTELRSAVLDGRPELDLDTVVLTGPPIPTLIAASEPARLMVLGSRGLGGFTGMLIGSTAVALAAHGHCPVAVVRGEDQPPSSGPVVVGVDGSPASETAVAVAFEEASLRGAELVAVHTWNDYASDGSFAAAHAFIADWGVIETREAEKLAERLAGWQEKYPDVTVRRVVTRDRPVRCLLQEAADAQLLVVGSRGRGGFTGMLLGSTSQALVCHAPCPVLVARPTTT
ncbi:MAG TPA: universal stress protein [Pseudonocardiaceae bacterium]|nr:universal stress protein [Pseudonocardiaceae bacterium]